MVRAMFCPDNTLHSVDDLRDRLAELRTERALVAGSPLRRNADYMSDLEHELAGVEAAYVGAAVTEIASLRAQLAAPLQG
jgi:hypothetical protein